MEHGKSPYAIEGEEVVRRLGMGEGKSSEMRIRGPLNLVNVENVECPGMCCYFPVLV